MGNPHVQFDEGALETRDSVTRLRPTLPQPLAIFNRDPLYPSPRLTHDASPEQPWSARNGRTIWIRILAKHCPTKSFRIGAVQMTTPPPIRNRLGPPRQHKGQVSYPARRRTSPALILGLYYPKTLMSSPIWRVPVQGGDEVPLGSSTPGRPIRRSDSTAILFVLQQEDGDGRPNRRWARKTA
jgi:hypothetical protein